MRYEVKVKPLSHPRRWELLEDFSAKGVLVPEGFDTDGASIPLGFRWFFPHGGAKFAPAVLHDYCYRTHVVDKEIADKNFFDMMVINKVDWYKAYIMYLAVHLFGWYAWRKSFKKAQNGA